jgi:hypothetical protein
MKTEWLQSNIQNMQGMNTTFIPHENDIAHALIIHITKKHQLKLPIDLTIRSFIPKTTPDHTTMHKPHPSYNHHRMKTKITKTNSYNPNHTNWTRTDDLTPSRKTNKTNSTGKPNLYSTTSPKQFPPENQSTKEQKW